MPRSKKSIDKKSLTKGELRKLNALKNSIGDKLGEEAFAKWYAEQNRDQQAADPNIEAIEKALNPHLKKIRIPRGGAYAIRRGRGRFIIESIEIKD